ncbi:hypothetical protein [Nonomuraea endophytica]|uniref:DUF1795 domain-containing protein n=1 Tax=Nonomuraea endophytica TaxID=714136 RepID=A0A7W8A1K7_9ACTN|nr:hypothetical protein [Nonomuraea endophytica]MBB5076743.1 hypothetical protein [Nonomuraea endophytica]
MTVTVTWPNDVSPGLWPFRISVPDGWTAIEPPDALIAFLGPERHGSRPTVLVFGARLPDAQPLGDLAEQVLLDLGAGSVLRPVAEDGRAVVREAVVDVDGRAFRHVVLVTGRQDRSPNGLRTVHTLLGTQPAAEPDVLADILTSFTG